MKVKKDIYQEVTNNVIASLEAIENGSEAENAFECPWVTFGVKNAFSGHAYQGLNTLILSLSMAVNGWKDGRFATFNQIKKEGGNVKKGEKGTQITFWNFIKDRKDPSKTFPLLKTFTVFNVMEQAENVTLKEIQLPNKEEKMEAIEEMIKKTGAIVNHGGEGAFYNNTSDEITMPVFESFKDSESYYGVLFHELTHWTKAEQRLDRRLGKKYGKKAQAMEECVAELGSSFLCRNWGIQGTGLGQNVSYIKGWISLLKEDKKAIFKASSLAEKAVKFIEGKVTEKEENLQKEN